MQSIREAEVLEPVPYRQPRRVWVDDGHVMIEGHDGTILTMTPEVAIHLGRLLSETGTESLINKVMDATDKAQAPA